MAELINTTKTQVSFVADWTQTTNLSFFLTPARDTYSAGQNSGNAIDAILAPSSLSGGGNPSSFVVYWQETSSQTGFTFQYVDSSGQVILELGGNNPQWEINDGDGAITPYGGDNYDSWIKYEVAFDWANGEYTYTMEDMQSGHIETGTRSLIYNTDLEEFKINNSNGNWGSADYMWIDDISIGGSSFTSETVHSFNAVYSQENGVLIPVNTDGLVGYWPISEGGDLTAYDESKNGNDGTIYGAIWTDTANGKALDCDGVDDYVGTPQQPSSYFSVAPNTVISGSAWIKTTNTASHGTTPSRAQDSPAIIYGKTFTYRCAWGFHIDDGHLRFTIWELDFGGDADTIDGTTVINDNNWHYVAFVYNDSTDNIILYVDGVIDVSQTTTKQAVKESRENEIHIGARVLDSGDAGSYFAGCIAEVRIYDRALTEQEITNIYEKTRGLYGV